MNMRLKPRRAASEMRLSVWETGRISPLSPTSPAKQLSEGIAKSKLDESTAQITARSQAGSLTLMPPAMLRNTSLALSLKPARFSSTASSMFSLRMSNPVAERWAVA